MSVDVRFTSAEAEQFRQMDAVEDRLWWYRALRGFVLSVLPPRVNDTPSIAVDIGCGNGSFTAALASRGHSVIGIDLSELALSNAQSRGLSERVAVADAQRLPLRTETIDLVVSLDVLETRWVKPDVMLDEIARVLKPGGVALIQAAAFQWLLSQHDQAVGSTHRYHRNELISLGESAGLRCERSGYFFLLLFPLMLAHKLIHRPRKNANTARSAIAMPPRIVNEVLFRICELERALSRTYTQPFGSSVYALFRKES